ncbi:MAG: hypothetical protein MUC35_04605 [Candidatus Margulisbacteria bacterium]|jgi:hypothetical protein|nr:hypothetical protein [Candidatus Margulisiibacteriota bacterium]
MGNDYRRLAHEYAWNWFSYHSNQRLTAFHFYLIIFGALVFGYSQSLEKNPWVALIIALFGVFVSYVFVLIDVRNEELVQYGRKALDKTEKMIKMDIRNNDKHRKSFNEVIKDEQFALGLSKDQIRHRSLLRNVEKLAIVIFLSGAGFSLFKLIK